MAEFPIHTRDTAPAPARGTLGAVEKKFGFIPNILGVMAGAPALLNAYAAVSDAFESSSLTAAEQIVVLMEASFQNTCHY